MDKRNPSSDYMESPFDRFAQNWHTAPVFLSPTPPCVRAYSTVPSGSPLVHRLKHLYPNQLDGNDSSRGILSEGLDPHHDDDKLGEVLDADIQPVIVRSPNQKSLISQRSSFCGDADMIDIPAVRISSKRGAFSLLHQSLVASDISSANYSETENISCITETSCSSPQEDSCALDNPVEFVSTVSIDSKTLLSPSSNFAESDTQVDSPGTEANCPVPFNDKSTPLSSGGIEKSSVWRDCKHFSDVEDIREDYRKVVLLMESKNESENFSAQMFATLESCYDTLLRMKIEDVDAYLFEDFFGILRRAIHCDRRLHLSVDDIQNEKKNAITIMQVSLACALLARVLASPITPDYYCQDNLPELVAETTEWLFSSQLFPLLESMGDINLKKNSFLFAASNMLRHFSSLIHNRSVSPSVISAAERICVQGLFLHSKNHSSTSAVLRCVMSIRRECGFLLSEIIRVYSESSVEAVLRLLLSRLCDFPELRVQETTYGLDPLCYGIISGLQAFACFAASRVINTSDNAMAVDPSSLSVCSELEDHDSLLRLRIELLRQLRESVTRLLNVWVSGCFGLGSETAVRLKIEGIHSVHRFLKVFIRDLLSTTSSPLFPLSSICLHLASTWIIHALKMEGKPEEKWIKFLCEMFSDIAISTFQGIDSIRDASGSIVFRLDKPLLSDNVESNSNVDGVPLNDMRNSEIQKCAVRFFSTSLNASYSQFSLPSSPLFISSSDSESDSSFSHFSNTTYVGRVILSADVLRCLLLSSWSCSFPCQLTTQVEEDCQSSISPYGTNSPAFSSILRSDLKQDVPLSRVCDAFITFFVMVFPIFEAALESDSKSLLTVQSSSSNSSLSSIPRKATKRRKSNISLSESGEYLCERPSVYSSALISVHRYTLEAIRGFLDKYHENLKSEFKSPVISVPSDKILIPIFVNTLLNCRLGVAYNRVRDMFGTLRSLFLKYKFVSVRRLALKCIRTLIALDISLASLPGVVEEILDHAVSSTHAQVQEESLLAITTIAKLHLSEQVRAPLISHLIRNLEKGSVNLRRTSLKIIKDILISSDDLDPSLSVSALYAIANSTRDVWISIRRPAKEFLATFWFGSSAEATLDSANLDETSCRTVVDPEKIASISPELCRKRSALLIRVLALCDLSARSGCSEILSITDSDLSSHWLLDVLRCADRSALVIFVSSLIELLLEFGIEIFESKGNSSVRSVDENSSSKANVPFSDRSNIAALLFAFRLISLYDVRFVQDAATHFLRVIELSLSNSTLDRLTYMIRCTSLQILSRIFSHGDFPVSSTLETSIHLSGKLLTRRNAFPVYEAAIRCLVTALERHGDRCLLFDHFVDPFGRVIQYLNGKLRCGNSGSVSCSDLEKADRVSLFLTCTFARHFSIEHLAIDEFVNSSRSSSVRLLRDMDSKKLQSLIVDLSFLAWDRASSSGSQIDVYESFSSFLSQFPSLLLDEKISEWFSRGFDNVISGPICLRTLRNLIFCDGNKSVERTSCDMEGDEYDYLSSKGARVLSATRRYEEDSVIPSVVQAYIEKILELSVDSLPLIRRLSLQVIQSAEEHRMCVAGQCHAQVVRALFDCDSNVRLDARSFSVDILEGSTSSSSTRSQIAHFFSCRPVDVVSGIQLVLMHRDLCIVNDESLLAFQTILNSLNAAGRTSVVTSFSSLLKGSVEKCYICTGDEIVSSSQSIDDQLSRVELLLELLGSLSFSDRRDIVLISRIVKLGIIDDFGMRVNYALQKASGRNILFSEDFPESGDLTIRDSTLADDDECSRLFRIAVLLTSFSLFFKHLMVKYSLSKGDLETASQFVEDSAQPVDDGDECHGNLRGRRTNSSAEHSSGLSPSQLSLPFEKPLSLARSVLQPNESSISWIEVAASFESVVSEDLFSFHVSSNALRNRTGRRTSNQGAGSPSKPSRKRRSSSSSSRRRKRQIDSDEDEEEFEELLWELPTSSDTEENDDDDTHALDGEESFSI